MEDIETIYGDILEEHDSQTLGKNEFFYAFHFDFYNRFSKGVSFNVYLFMNCINQFLFILQGHDAPTGADPALFQNNPSYPTNSTSNIPRASKERRLNPEAYETTNTLLASTFSEVVTIVRIWVIFIEYSY